MKNVPPSSLGSHLRYWIQGWFICMFWPSLTVRSRALRWAHTLKEEAPEYTQEHACYHHFWIWLLFFGMDFIFYYINACFHMNFLAQNFARSTFVHWNTFCIELEHSNKDLFHMTCDDKILHVVLHCCMDSLYWTSIVTRAPYVLYISGALKKHFEYMVYSDLWNSTLKY